MKEILIRLDDNVMQELKDAVGAKHQTEAIHLAIKFTLLHDKDSIQEALKIRK